jgi:hypothetical protein
MVKQNNERSFPVEFQEHLAENMKERVYATITLIAVITALWQVSELHTFKGVLASIGGTVVALWLATLVSARVSHHAIYGKSMDHSELRRLIFTSSGVFTPAIVPVILVLLSGVGLMSIKNALFGGIVTLLLSLFLLSFVAGRRIYPSVSRVILISALEMSVGIGVVLLKLAVGE